MMNSTQAKAALKVSCGAGRSAVLTILDQESGVTPWLLGRSERRAILPSSRGAGQTPVGGHRNQARGRDLACDRWSLISSGRCRGSRLGLPQAGSEAQCSGLACK